MFYLTITRKGLRALMNRYSCQALEAIDNNPLLVTVRLKRGSLKGRSFFYPCGSIPKNFFFQDHLGGYESIFYQALMGTGNIKREFPMDEAS